jgi:DNA-binding NtrC family response regulator
MMNPLSLLFVDDESDFLSTIEDFFRGLGYTVYTARNGQEALLRLKEHRPNVVFLDISMPHMDGNETLRLVQEVAPETKVVIVSGYASAQLARDLLQRGAYDFFQKPVDLVQLQEAVDRLQALRDLS